MSFLFTNHFKFNFGGIFLLCCHIFPPSLNSVYDLIAYYYHLFLSTQSLLPGPKKKKLALLFYYFTLYIFFKFGLDLLGICGVQSRFIMLFLPTDVSYNTFFSYFFKKGLIFTAILGSEHN